MDIEEFFLKKKLKKKLSQLYYARRAGLSPAAINKITQAHVIPHMETAKKLAEATDWEISEYDILEYCLEKKLEHIRSEREKSQVKQCIPTT